MEAGFCNPASRSQHYELRLPSHRLDSNNQHRPGWLSADVSHALPRLGAAAVLWYAKGQISREDAA